MPNEKQPASFVPISGQPEDPDPFAEFVPPGEEGPPPLEETEAGSTKLARIRADTRRQLDRSREKVSQGLRMVGDGWDIAQLTETEFAELLELDKKRQARALAIIRNQLEDGIHYGKVPGIREPFAFKPAGNAIAKLFRWSCQPLEAPVVIVVAPSEDEPHGYASVSVVVGVYDVAGRQLCTEMRACSTKEARFYKQRGSVPKFKDARGTLNELEAMAFKRAKLACILAAANVAHVFAEPDRYLVEGLSEDPILTEDERDALYQKAFEAGIDRETFIGIAKEAIGRDADPVVIHTGDEVGLVSLAIDKWVSDHELEGALKKE